MSRNGDESFVQALPPGVKNGLAGSVLPEIIRPQVHSRLTLPSLSRHTPPSASRSISVFSVARKSLEKPSWAKYGKSSPSCRRMPTASNPVLVFNSTRTRRMESRRSPGSFSICRTSLPISLYAPAHLRSVMSLVVPKMVTLPSGWE